MSAVSKMGEKVVYIGKDLEAMSFAVNYHRWIYDEISSYIGKNIIEVGAGVGSFSAMLLEGDPDTLSLVEPSALYNRLSGAFSNNACRTKIGTYNAIFA